MAKKTNMFRPAGSAKRVKKAGAPEGPTAAQRIDNMTTQQQQAAEQYLQTTAALARRLVEEKVVPRSQGTGLQQYMGAYRHIEESVAEAMDLLARKLKNPNVAELAAALSGLIGMVIAEASSRGVKQEVTEDMLMSLEQMIGAGVRLTTIEGQRLAQSKIVTPAKLH